MAVVGRHCIAGSEGLTVPRVPACLRRHQRDGATESPQCHPRLLRHEFRRPDARIQRQPVHIPIVRRHGGTARERPPIPSKGGGILGLDQSDTVTRGSEPYIYGIGRHEFRRPAARDQQRQPVHIPIVRRHCIAASDGLIVPCVPACLCRHQRDGATAVPEPHRLLLRHEFRRPPSVGSEC